MQQRQSNIELLRIISMFMILIVHFDGGALDLPLHFEPWTVTNGIFGYCSKEIIEAFAIIGVNCFVLISGYFGIKLSVKSASKFILCCLFYSVLIFVVKATFDRSMCTLDNAINSFLIFSHTDLWFLAPYLMLMLLSPLINGGVEALNKQNIKFTIVALVFINCYMGWLCDNPVNTTGYNLMQLIMIYIFGRYIGIYLRFGIENNRKKYMIVSLTLYLISVMTILISTMFLTSIKAFAYNSPFVILASVSFFLFFSSLKINSKVINWLASSSFAVYLIHKNPYVWVDLKHYIRELSSSSPYFLFTLECIAIMVVIFLCSVIIDKLRLKLFSPRTYTSKY